MPKQLRRMTPFRVWKLPQNPQSLMLKPQLPTLYTYHMEMTMPTTTETTTTETPIDNPTPENIDLIVGAKIDAGTALEKTEANSETVKIVSEKTAENAEQISEVEKWQTKTSETMAQLLTAQASLTEQMTTLAGALSAVLALPTLTIPPSMSSVDVDGTQMDATATNAQPNDPAASLETPTLEAEQVIKQAAQNPLTWI